MGKTSPRRVFSEMKKLILKTALATLGVILILAVALFGILSLVAPAVMMDFTESIGLPSISGDYAWQEYERSGNMDCLARSFLTAAEHGENKKAAERFEEFYRDREAFSAYCEKQSIAGDDLPAYLQEISYRDYVCGKAAQVKLRLARTDEQKDEAIRFAISETASSFPSGNPVVSLAVEAAGNGNAAVCARILELIAGEHFDQNTEYLTITSILKNTQKTA